MEMRRNSRGNPWHYPAGHPRGGQFAPAGTTGAVAIEGGMNWGENPPDNLAEQTAGFYKERKEERFSQKPSENMQKQVERTAKALGEQAPQFDHVIDAYDYVAGNRPAIERPTEKQARAIRKFEEKGYPSPGQQRDALSRVHAGAYIGAMKEADELKNPANWTKHADGTRTCGRYTIKPNGDGTYSLYRNEKTGHKVQAVDESGNPVFYKNGNPKMVNEMVERRVNLRTKDGKEMRPSKTPKDLTSYASRQVVREYQSQYPNKDSRRRAARNPNVSNTKTTVENAKQYHRNLYKILDHQNEDGSYSIKGNSFNNNSEYRIYQNEEGMWCADRHVEFDKQSHGKRYGHKRMEHIGHKFNSPEEAKKAVLKYDKKVYYQQINPKAASDREIESWGFESREEYEKHVKL